MSLLLEALKKAELTKQAAKERAVEEERPPFTRDRLPDITQPMEIHSDDLSLMPEPAPAPHEGLSLQVEPGPDPLPEPAPRPAASPAPGLALQAEPAAYSPAPSESVERKQAQQLFEAKELDINPRKPFYITVGALGVFALCTVGYFWYQLQPRNNFKVIPPSAQPARQPAVAAPVTPAPPAAAAATAPGASTVNPPAGTQPDVTAAPATQAAAGSSPPNNAATRRTGTDSRGATAARAPAQAVAPAVASAETRPASPAGPARREIAAPGVITINPASAQVDPVLETAYQAFNAGDLAGARSNYQQVLRANPASRDALLGLAAVETRAGRLDAAEAFYLRLLEIDPRDMHAQAGIYSLRGQADPLAAESRLKSMIAAQPDAGFLQFTLGNQLAAQARWPEAQQAYFRAFTGDPGNAEFAFNLAVSLDQMRQPKVALDYYRRALSLAGNRQVSFDKAQLAKRISQLER